MVGAVGGIDTKTETMSEFYIQYYTRTRLNISDWEEWQQTPLPAHRFNFRDATVAMRDWVRQEGANKLHLGLEFIVQTRATNEEEAKEKSKGVVELILNLIRFSTLSSCDAANIINVIEIKKDVNLSPSQFYIYPFKDDFISGSSVKIDVAIFGEIQNKYDKNEHQQRLMRAMSWFRKGLNETGLDEFISYWISVEILRGILKRIYMKENVTDDKWVGTKKVFEDKVQYSKFSEIKEIRNRILHGYKELSNEFVKEAVKYTPILRKGLIACISTVLDISDGTLNKIVNKEVRRVKLEQWQVIKGEIETLPHTFDGMIINYPKVVVKIKEKEMNRGKDGRLNITSKLEYTFLGGADTKFKIKEVEIWGDKQIENGLIEINED